MRLIDADKLIHNLREHKIPFNADINEIIITAPTVDAEPVVRCKDCYYCVTEKSFDKEYLYCDAFYEHAEGDLIGVSLMVEPNHFCSWGERKDD